MKKLIIFDMDGTIYLGKDLIDGALETFEYLNKNNIEYVFFTNKISYLKKNNIKDIYVIANKFLKDKLTDFNLIKTYQKDIKIDAVVAAFTTELVYDELRNAALFLETTDAKFIATNRDYRCPIEDGLYIPDCGGMCEWLRLTTGKVAHDLGKPDPEGIYVRGTAFRGKARGLAGICPEGHKGRCPDGQCCGTGAHEQRAQGRNLLYDGS